MKFKFQVIADNSGEWAGNATVYDTHAAAAAAAADLAMRWTLVRKWRVVPEKVSDETDRRRADIIAAVERDDMTGFCTACGDQAGPVEPDAREYRCESCGENAVYGAEELLFHFVS